MDSAQKSIIIKRYYFSLLKIGQLQIQTVMESPSDSDSGQQSKRQSSQNASEQFQHSYQNQGYSNDYGSSYKPFFYQRKQKKEASKKYNRLQYERSYENSISNISFQSHRNRKKQKPAKDQKARQRQIEQFRNSRVRYFLNNKATQLNHPSLNKKIPVYFPSPYNPYKQQIIYVGKVIQALEKQQNALLQSPTGTGKTMCLLSGSLSWLYSRKRDGHHPKIIYLSRTHSQLKQVENELKKSGFNPVICHYASRDIFCIKKQFENMHGEQLSEACYKASRQKTKGYQNNQKQQKIQSYQKEQNQKNQQEQQKHQDQDKISSRIVDSQEIKNISCEFYRQKHENQNLVKSGLNTLYDMDEFRSLGQKQHFCPYYYPYHINQYADLIFMPYNYLLSVQILQHLSHLIQHNVLIFDEAHNVADAARQGRSFRISSSFFQAIKTQCFRMNRQTKNANIGKILKQIRILSGNLKINMMQFLEYIPFDMPNDKQKIYKGQSQNEMIKIFDTSTMPLAIHEMITGQTTTESLKDYQRNPIQFLKFRYNDVIQKISQITKLIQQIQRSQKNKEIDNFQIYMKKTKKLNTFLSKLQKIYKSIYDSKLNLLERESTYYRLVITQKKINQRFKPKTNEQQGPSHEYTIQLKCLQPSLTFKEIQGHKPHSMIFTSGTLSPLQAWQRQIDIKAQIKFSNNHVINKDQVMMNIVEGTKSTVFDFSYKSLITNEEFIYQSLVESIYDISKMVPGGMLVVCPNYKSLNKLKYKIMQRQTFNKLKSIKKQIFEERGEQNQIKTFKQAAQQGAIFYCVCRGKASEGIDFPDDKCRAVIIIGIPFPNLKDPLLIERKEHLQKIGLFLKQNNLFDKKKHLSWSDQYFNNTLRAVNQSLGRVIRHSKDYGAMFLLDQRYKQNRNQAAMPSWATKQINNWPLITHNETKKVYNFFESNSKKYPCQKQETKKQEFNYSDYSCSNIDPYDF